MAAKEMLWWFVVHYLHADVACKKDKNTYFIYSRVSNKHTRPNKRKCGKLCKKPINALVHIHMLLGNVFLLDSKGHVIMHKVNNG